MGTSGIVGSLGLKSRQDDALDSGLVMGGTGGGCFGGSKLETEPRCVGEVDVATEDESGVRKFVGVVKLRDWENDDTDNVFWAGKIPSES